MRRTRLTVQDFESRLTPATFTVTSPADSGPGTLRDALGRADVSPGPDTVVFHLPAGSVIALTSGELTSRGDVTISGPGPGKLIIDGGTSSRAFNIDDGVVNGDSPATITGLSVIRGNAQAFAGGGIYSTESLTLKNVVVSDCVAGADGGGVCVQGNGIQTANISGCIFVNNTTGAGGFAWGGGLAVESVASFRIANVTATGNSGAVEGGGIYAVLQPSASNNHATGTIGPCLITNNRAESGAGIEATNVLAPGTRILIHGVTVAHNTSTVTFGGGVEVGGYNVSFNSSTITDNTAREGGGGLSAGLRGPLTVSNCTISGNTTTVAQTGYGGGGVMVLGHGLASPVTISASRITDNQGAGQGGGLFAGNGIKLAVSGCAFSGNSAAQEGGGLVTTGAGTDKVDIFVTGGSFVGNSAAWGGAAVYTAGDGTVHLTNSTVTGNTSSLFAGAVEIQSNSSATVEGLKASGNTGDEGGALDIVSTPDFHVVGGRIAGNTAYDGGGVYVSYSSGSIVGVTITGNVAANLGGGVYKTGFGTVTLEAKLVTGNTAANDPEEYGSFTII